MLYTKPLIAKYEVCIPILTQASSEPQNPVITSFDFLDGSLCHQFGQDGSIPPGDYTMTLFATFQAGNCCVNSSATVAVVTVTQDTITTQCGGVVTDFACNASPSCGPNLLVPGTYCVTDLILNGNHLTGLPLCDTVNAADAGTFETLAPSLCDNTLFCPTT